MKSSSIRRAWPAIMVSIVPSPAYAYRRSISGLESAGAAAAPFFEFLNSPVVSMALMLLLLAGSVFLAMRLLTAAVACGSVALLGYAVRYLGDKVESRFELLIWIVAAIFIVLSLSRIARAQRRDDENRSDLSARSHRRTRGSCASAQHQHYIPGIGPSSAAPSDRTSQTGLNRSWR